MVKTFDAFTTLVANITGRITSNIHIDIVSFIKRKFPVSIIYAYS